MEEDSPNYFTAAFFDGGFAESKTRQVKTDRHPRLFALIVEHLSGYPILPLQPTALPSTMSVEIAQECLLRDARYFGLEQLEHLLSPPIDNLTLPSSISTMFRGTTIYPLDRLCENGDLNLDSKVYRPFHMPKPMPLTSLPSNALFVVRGVLMQYVRAIPYVSRLAYPYSRSTSFVLQSHADSMTLCLWPEFRSESDRYRRLQSSEGLVNLTWSALSKRTGGHSAGTAFKLNDETITIETLERAVVAASTRGTLHHSIKFGTAQVHLRKNARDEILIDVVADTLLVSIDASAQMNGVYSEAQATFVYAELKTVEEWTKSDLASAISVRSTFSYLFCEQYLC